MRHLIHKLLFLLIITTSVYSQAISVCNFSKTPEEMFKEVLSKQEDMEDSSYFNYQDSFLRIEKRLIIQDGQEVESYNYWRVNNCIGRTPASHRTHNFKRIRKKRKQASVRVRTGFKFYRSRSNYQGFSALLVSEASPFLYFNYDLFLSRRLQVSSEMGITMLKINPFDKIKTLDNQDMNLMEYSLGLRYFITRKLTVQGKVGIQEILMNQASSLDTIELLKDSAPKVELLVNYNLLKYKKAKLNTEAMGGKLFTGQKNIVESGTFYGLGVSFDYKIGQGLLSSGIKSIKRDLDGIYYEAEENENEISFSYQYNF